MVDRDGGEQGESGNLPSVSERPRRVNDLLGFRGLPAEEPAATRFLSRRYSVEKPLTPADSR